MTPDLLCRRSVCSADHESAATEFGLDRQEDGDPDLREIRASFLIVKREKALL
jgi:hypothetical protein